MGVINILTTNNLELKKPQETDVVNIDDINSNMDKIDTELIKKASSSSDGRMSKEDKIKLDGIASKANKYVHPAKHIAGIITQDSTHRFVTDEEKNAWNNKVDEEHIHDDMYYTENEIDSKLSEINTSITNIANDVKDNKNDIKTNIDKIDNNGYKTAGGSANIITVSKSSFILTNGQYIDFKARYTNTSSVNILVNSYSSKDLKNADGTELGVGDIEANNYYRAIWNGSFFVLASKGGLKINDVKEGEFTAGETITKGDLIDIIDDKIMKAQNEKVIPHLGFVFNGGSTYYISLTMLTPTKALVSYKCCCTILTITDTHISQGRRFYFNNSMSETKDTYVIKLSDTKALVCFKDMDNSGKGTASVLTVNGTDISVGPKVVFENDFTDRISITKLTETKAVVCYGCNRKGRARVLNVNGSNISVGIANEFSNRRINDTEVTAVTSDKIIICYYIDQEDRDDDESGYVVLCTITNNILSFGGRCNFVSEVAWNTSGARNISITKLSDTKAVVCCSNNNEKGRGEVSIISIDGIYISINKKIFSLGYTRDISVAALTDTKVVICYQGKGSVGRTRILNIGSTSTSHFGAETIFNNVSYTRSMDVKKITGDKALVAYNNGEAENGIVRVLSISKLASGIAQQNRSINQSIKITYW